jgi:hypothetical protein
VARHLATRHQVADLVLASRSGPAAPGAAALAAALAGAGAGVRVVAADLARRAAATALVAGITGLAGVVHAAGVLEDRPVTALDAGSLGRVLAAKADAAWHLHEATRGRDLQMFVLFSSLSGLAGGPGQGNYAAANTYLDALAACRRAQGLPGVSVAWGLWEQASAMTGALTGADRARLARGGGAVLGTGQALGLLDAALGGPWPVVAAGLDLAAVRAAITAGTPVPAVLAGLGRAPRRAAVAGAGSASALARRLAGLPSPGPRRGPGGGAARGPGVPRPRLRLADRGGAAQPAGRRGRADPPRHAGLRLPDAAGAGRAPGRPGDRRGRRGWRGGGAGAVGG